MNAEDIKKVIKQRGYWEIVFTPSVFNSETIPDRTTCKKILQENSVRLRGWDYPHIPQQNTDDQKIAIGNDYCEAFVDWGNHKEVLRLYQSGQYVHYLANHEDWMSEDRLSQLVGISDPYRDIKPGSVLSFIGAVYTLTEIYEFLRRLASSTNIYDSGVNIEIKLHGTQSKKLVSLDPNRIELFGNYISEVPDIVFPIKKLTKIEVLNSSKELALDSAKYLFETFNWENMPMHVFQKDQQNLLERRF